MIGNPDKGHLSTPARLGVTLIVSVFLTSMPLPAQAQSLGNPDLDGNGQVDTADLIILRQEFDALGNDLLADLNQNGRVDIFDFSLLLASFGNEITNPSPLPTSFDSSPTPTVPEPTPTTWIDPPTPFPTAEMVTPSPTITSLGISILQNGDFELVQDNSTTLEPWSVALKTGVTYNLVSPGYNSDHGLYIKLASSADNPQLLQRNLTLQSATRYILTFAAKANKDRRIVANLQDDQTGSKYGLQGQEFLLNSSWQEFAHEFETPTFTAPVTNARLRLNLGSVFGNDLAEYWFDNIMVKPSE